MNVESVSRHFANIGARLRVRRVRQLQNSQSFDLDIARDKNGEHFRLSIAGNAPDMNVLQANRAGRHLLLHATGPDGGERFLCGHDERHWFVAAVSERVSTVTDAKRALLPVALRDAGLTPDTLARRHTDAFLRQGEWFFVPTDRDLSKCPILHQEPLVRGRGGKPHLVSELVRFGGTPVVLHRGREYTPEQWETFHATNPGAFGQRLMKDPEVYARGFVRHADHATLSLKGWHRVYPNSEARSINVSFYD